MTALDNVLLPHFTRIASPLWRSRRREKKTFAETATLLRLTPPNAAALARTYSGGNQQKLVVGRWLTEKSNASVLLLDEPTQGIDVGARADLYELVRRFAAKPGRGVLFTSSDPEEARALADRVLVIARGQLVAELRGEEIADQTMLDIAHQSTVQSQPNRGTNVS
jgi:ABC-type sugar transport system ATPase subunit